MVGRRLLGASEVPVFLKAASAPFCTNSRRMNERGTSDQSAWCISFNVTLHSIFVLRPPYERFLSLNTKPVTHSRLSGGALDDLLAVSALALRQVRLLLVQLALDPPESTL